MISPTHNSSTTKIDIAFLSNQKKLYNNIYFDNSNVKIDINNDTCLLYTSPSPRDS